MFFVRINCRAHKCEYYQGEDAATDIVTSMEYAIAIDTYLLSLGRFGAYEKGMTIGNIACYFDGLYFVVVGFNIKNCPIDSASSLALRNDSIASSADITIGSS